MEQIPQTENIESPEQSVETENPPKDELVALMKEHAKTGDHIDGNLVIDIINKLDKTLTESDFDKIIKYAEKAIERQNELRKAGNGKSHYNAIINHIRSIRGWDRAKK